MMLLEEMELRHRFEKKYKIGHCHVPFYRYVRHDANITNNKEDIEYYSQFLQQKIASQEAKDEGT
jgi:hypothetical protein